MTKIKCAIFSAFLFLLVQLPVGAHVKWFLSKSEQALLLQSKPTLFTSLGWENVSVMLLAGTAFYIAWLANQRLRQIQISRKLQALCPKWDALISLLINVSTGLMLIKCSSDMTFMVPNLHLHPCCMWIAQAEALIGAGLILGFLTRACGAAMLFLLCWSFVKFSIGDCIDLTPMYGLALYALLAGRGKWSVDFGLGLTHETDPFLPNLAYLCLRVALGIGLISLGLDEKILNPQLALDLLQHAPGLNCLQSLGMNNELFVLCSGATEIVLGLMLTFGVFPRTAALALLSLFVATTAIFGVTEFVGHLPYYGMILIIVLKGTAQLDFGSIRLKALLLRHALDKSLVPLAELR